MWNVWELCLAFFLSPYLPLSLFIIIFWLTVCLVAPSNEFSTVFLDSHHHYSIPLADLHLSTPRPCSVGLFCWDSWHQWGFVTKEKIKPQINPAEVLCRFWSCGKYWRLLTRRKVQSTSWLMVVTGGLVLHFGNFIEKMTPIFSHLSASCKRLLCAAFSLFISPLLPLPVPRKLLQNCSFRLL